MNTETVNVTGTLIQAAATEENARRWSATVDQYVFCLDLLHMSLTFDGDRACDRAVDRLEERFCQILGIPN